MSEPLAQADPLSPLAHQLISASTYQRLVVGQDVSPAQAEALAKVTSAEIFASEIRSRAYAQLTRAALWLWNDGLDQAHRIVQLDPAELRKLPIENEGSKALALQQSQGFCNDAGDEEIASTAAFWHGIIHRREGDFSNSRYWFRRCREHPAWMTLSRRVEDLTNTEPANKAIFRLTANGFDPDAFVGFVQQVHADGPTSPNHRIAVQIAKMEWRTLFDFCTRWATVLT